MNEPIRESQFSEATRLAADSRVQARPNGGWKVWIERLGLRSTRMWWVTAACAVLAMFLVATAWRIPGPTVTIEFAEGHGIQPGDPVRLRGIDVGVVERVVLDSALERVLVTAQLMRESSGLARAGTLFWIERPQVGLGAVRGLDTVVGPKYVGVQPGSSDGPVQNRFLGVESPRQVVGDGKRTLTLEFRQGHGIRSGSPVRFRGVEVGEVVEVGLSAHDSTVRVQVELTRGAAGLAREGSQFWIERPQLSVLAVRGLDTMVTGPYLAVSPGPADGSPVDQLAGLESPPAESDAVGGIEITLESDARHGLQTGSPVTYRGVTIGRVMHVGLASDAASVETRVYIEPEYREVVRDTSKFWPISGVDVRLGLTGVTLDADSLATITAGGLAVATPTEAGRPVAAGHRFRLETQGDEQWLEWRPHLAVGARVLPDGEPLAVGLRGTFTWKQRRWGVTRSRQQGTWVHVLSGPRLLCALAVSEQDALPPELKLEIEGQTIPLTTENLQLQGPLALIQAVNLPPSTSAWEPGELRAPAQPEDCVLVAGTDSMTIAAARLQDGEPWAVDTSLPLTVDWHGACAVARADGALIGLVVWRDGAAYIAPWQPASR
ncbi:MAG: MlaD family protein [Pirellulaceae bacterium]